MYKLQGIENNLVQCLYYRHIQNLIFLKVSTRAKDLAIFKPIRK